MRLRLAVALGLTLAAGCSGTGARLPDASREAAAGDVARPEVSANDGGADVGTEIDADSGPDLDADDDRGPQTTDATDATDADGSAPGADANIEEGADARDEGGADQAVEVSPDVGEAGGPNLCARAGQTIRLPSAPIKGVLSGPSENPAVSCSGFFPTEGPEAVFALEIAELTTVALRVDAQIPTFIAIRPGCSNGISEIACGNSAPPPDTTADADAGVSDGGTPDAADADGSSADADGAPAPSSPLVSTALRVRLAPGTYYVVIDTFSALGTLPSGTSPDFTLTIGTVAPQKNASCATPLLLGSSATATHQQLDLAGAPASACGGSAKASLYYAVGVPSGQRLTARAVPKGGDKAWMPRLEAFSACGSSSCLAQGHAAAGATQQLDWTNNGPTWRLILVSVAADSAVNGAEFDLAVGIADLLATCSRPTPVQDGTTLLNQDLQQALPAATDSCTGQSAHAIYYAATLLPQQEITATAVASATQFSAPPALGLRTGCDTACLTVGDNVTYTNTSNATKAIIIEASSSGNGPDGLFDLHVSIPLPPAGIAITPPAGLVTSETGGSATFQVVLLSPPTAAVTIGLASDTPSEGTASQSSVQFDSTNWDTPHTVAVTGVNDQLSDGPRRYLIVTAAAVSADSRYSGMDVTDVEVTNLDDDPGLSVDGADALATSEAGATATFKVRLNRQPTSTVRVPLTSSDISEGTVSPAELVFSPTDWDTPRDVTVTGVDDAIFDGTQTYAVVVGPLVSTDPGYAGQDPPDIAVHNRDNDYHAVVTKLLSGDHVCNPTSGRQIALDAFNTIYIVMFCDGGLYLVTSTDGGVTFSEPFLFPQTSEVDGNVALAAGRGGAAYLAYEVPSTGLMFTRTTDSGLSWSPPQSLLSYSGDVRVAAAEDTVIVMAAGPNGAGNTVLWRSLNGGRSLFPRMWIDSAPLDALVQPDGKTVWLLRVNADGELRKSTDAGATFAKVTTLGPSLNLPALGHQSLFAFSGSDLFTASLADPTQNQTFFGFDVGPMALAVDETDTLTILGGDQQFGRLKALRFAAGATAPSDEKTVGPRVDAASAVALSHGAVATCSDSGGVTLFTVTTWP
jgi:hypothetical protein